MHKPLRINIVSIIQKYFGCGNIRRDYSDKTLKYEVRSLDELIGKVIPHFRKFPLLSAKKKDFELFTKICEMMKRQKHLTKNGLEKIVSLAYQMNSSGRRRYKKEELFR